MRTTKALYLVGALTALALLCGAALAGPVAGRTLVLDVAQQDTPWSNICTRGEAYYLKVELRNRAQAYTNNDLRGYLWYASNSLSASGVKVNQYTQEAGAVWFYLSATTTLGLSTNAQSYFGQIVLSNATGSIVYDWKQGRFATRHGSGLTGAGVSPSTTIVNWDTISNIGTVPWGSGGGGSGISGATATTIVHNVTDAGFLATTGRIEEATNTLRQWVQDQGYGTGSGGGAVTSVFGRAGNVTAQTGDYTAAQVGAMTSGAVTSLVNGATQALAVVAHTGAYGDLSGAPSIPSTNGLDTVLARQQAVTGATQGLATVAHTGAYGDLSGTPSIPSTNGLDTVIAREQSVAASTQTIAGASVSGAVASSATATVAQAVALLSKIGNGCEIDEGISIRNIDTGGTNWLGVSIDSSLYYYFDGPGRTGELAFRPDKLEGLTGYHIYADFLGGKAASGYVTNGAKVGASTNADYATSAGTAANSTNLNGLAASRYPTNLAADVFDPCHIVSNIVASGAGCTVTVGRTSGEYVKIEAQTNFVLMLDMPSYPAETLPLQYVAVSNGPYSTTWHTNCFYTNAATHFFPGSGGLTPTNNDWNQHIINRVPGATNHLFTITKVP